MSFVILPKWVSEENMLVGRAFWREFLKATYFWRYLVLPTRISEDTLLFYVFRKHIFDVFSDHPKVNFLRERAFCTSFHEFLRERTFYNYFLIVPKYISEESMLFGRLFSTIFCWDLFFTCSLAIFWLEFLKETYLLLCPQWIDVHFWRELMKRTYFDVLSGAPKVNFWRERAFWTCFLIVSKQFL